MKKAYTTQTLRETLIDCINEVRSGRMESKQARDISALAGRVIETAKLEIEFAVNQSKLDRDDQGISAGPILLGESVETAD